MSERSHEMMRSVWHVSVLCLVFVIFGPITALHATETDAMADRLLSYSFVMSEPGETSTGDRGPGTVIGYTLRDRQQIGAMGRMIDWGYDPSYGPFVHSTWLNQSIPSGHLGSALYYTVYRCESGTLNSYQVNPNDTYGLSGNIDVTADNRAVVGGHFTDESPSLVTRLWWDFAPGLGFFGVPAVLDSIVWPKFRYQDVGSDTVTHVFAVYQTMTPEQDWYRLVYFRKAGSEETGSWQWPPYEVDTIFTYGFDLACSKIGGKVALTWIANLPNPGDCDTCSSNTGRPLKQADNDVYYQISTDYGATFMPRVNVTDNTNSNRGFRAYNDISALISSQNDLHIAWNGRYWDPDLGPGDEVQACRIFHWAEDFAYSPNPIRTVADLDWEQPYCTGGAWQLNGSKMSIAECDGKFYCLWVQFNDPPRGIDDDCASRAFSGNPEGAANGELYISVSDDDGYTWDARRNLSNTYTPYCDPGGGPGGECESEHWPSIVRHGMEMTCSEMTGVEIVDPSGSYSGSSFLDVQYINDADPGSVIDDEGSWQLAEVRWFRLACVDPIRFPRLVISLPDPPCPTCWCWGGSWPHCLCFCLAVPGEEESAECVLENVGNESLLYNIEIQEDNGPVGWLNCSSTSGTISAGSGNQETITILLNYGGVIDGAMDVDGRLIITSNAPSSPDTIPVSLSFSDPEPCDNPIARADFNADVVDAPPDLTAPGDPEGDFLTLYDTYGTILVRNSVGTLTDQPVEIAHDASTGSVEMSLYVAEHQPCDSLTVKWRSLAKSTNPQFSYIHVVGVDGSIGYLAYRSAGELTYNDGPSSTLPVVYTANQDQEFKLTVSFLSQTTDLYIDGSPVAGFQSLPFEDAASDIQRVKFHAQGENLVVDDIEVCLLCPPCSAPQAATRPNPDEGASVADMNTALSWKSGTVQLEADFNDKTIDAPIGTGGASVGEPYRVGGAITAVVRDYPFATPCLEIADADDYAAGAAEFYFLDDAELIDGVLTIRTWLWFDQLEDFLVSVREHGSASENFANIFFRPWGEINYSDENSTYTTIGTYEAGRGCLLIIVFDLDGGTYDVWFDNEQLLSDEPHGVAGRGVGQILFGCSHDGNLDGTMFIDDVEVTWDEACNSSYEIRLGTTDPPPFHGPAGSPVYDPGGLLTGVDYWWQVIETNDVGSVAGPVWTFNTTCCLGERRGNIDYDPADEIDISDLVFLVDYMFGGGPPPPCPEEADVNCDGELDIADLVGIVDYMFTSGPPPCRCDCSDCP